MKTTKKETARWAKARTFSVMVAVFAIAMIAIAGYVYGQNRPSGTMGHGLAYSQSSGNGMMSGAECDQMMQNLNISQSAIGSMNQMMAMRSGAGSGGMQNMMGNQSSNMMN